MSGISKFKKEISPFIKESWTMGWPMILIMFFHFTIGLTDVYVAGFMGTEVLASVGYVGQLYWTLMILATAISVGTVSMVSQAYGAKSDEGVSNISANSLFVGCLISGSLTVLAQIYANDIISVSGMPSGIRPIAETFIRIFSLVLVPTYLMIITGGILRSSGRIKIAMMNSCLASLCNIIGNFVLGFGFGPIPALGYAGIAWATALGTSLGMLLNMIHIFRGPYAIKLTRLRRPMFSCIRNLVKLGVPSALQQMAWNAGTLVVYFLVARLNQGEITALAAMTAGVRIEAIIFLPVFALNMAAAVITGNRIGEGDLISARKGARATAMLCVGIIIVPASLMFVFAPEISRWVTADPSVYDEMTRYLRINMLGMPFMAIGFTLSGALQGAGDTFGTMRIIFTGMWLIRIPMILTAIYVLQTSAVGVWTAMTISMIIMASMLLYRFTGEKWIRASIDRKTNALLWQGCLRSGQSGKISN